MEALTPKQEAFCQAVADGMTQADAYRTAYKAANMKPETIHARASELMADGTISGRVSQLKNALSARALWRREDSVRILSEIAQSDDARKAEKVQAVKELNAMHGYNEPAKVDLTTNGQSLAPAVIQFIGKDAA